MHGLSWNGQAEQKHSSLSYTVVNFPFPKHFSRFGLQMQQELFFKGTILRVSEVFLYCSKLHCIVVTAVFQKSGLLPRSGFTSTKLFFISKNIVSWLLGSRNTTWQVTQVPLLFSCFCMHGRIGRKYVVFTVYSALSFACMTFVVLADISEIA